MAIDKLQRSVRLTGEMLYKIKYISNKNRRSLNEQITYLIAQCIEQFEMEYGTIILPADMKKPDETQS